MKPLKLILPWLLILAATISCASQGWTELSVTERKMAYPPEKYKHVVYIDNKVIGFIDDDIQITGKDQPGFSYEGDPTMTPFNPAQDSKCIISLAFYVVGVLPDGRLGLLKECNDDSASTYFLSTNRSIFAYDWHTGELERLVTGKLTQGSRPKFFTWNPEMTLGIQETTGSYRATLYWIDRDGMFPMDIQIEDRGLNWNLKDYLEGEERTGIAVAPAWSPDGKTIAFFVSTYGILEEPKPKFNVNYDLFFMDPTTLKPEPELMNIADAGKIIWSPSNEYLLFSGCVGNKLTCGLWRYRISDQTLSLIKEGLFADYTWITNDKVAAIKYTDDTYNANEIWEYSIAD